MKTDNQPPKIKFGDIFSEEEKYEQENRDGKTPLKDDQHGKKASPSIYSSPAYSDRQSTDDSSYYRPVGKYPMNEARNSSKPEQPSINKAEILKAEQEMTEEEKQRNREENYRTVLNYPETSDTKKQEYKNEPTSSEYEKKGIKITEKQKSADKCTICLGYFKDSNDKYNCGCKTPYHKSCIERVVNCPICNDEYDDMLSPIINRIDFDAFTDKETMDACSPYREATRDYIFMSNEIKRAVKRIYNLCSQKSKNYKEVVRREISDILMFDLKLNLGEDFIRQKFKEEWKEYKTIMRFKETIKKAKGV